MPRPSRLLDLLLRLYPRWYRERYGREIEAFVREERGRGAGGPIFWLRLLADHGQAAWRVRIRGPGVPKGGGRGSRGEEGTMGSMTTVWTDLRDAARGVARAPRFALFAGLTLALGVGATAAVYTVVDRVVVRPLPYPGAERMARVGIESRFDRGEAGPLSAGLLTYLQANPGPAEAVAAARGTGAVLRGMGDPERVRLQAVSRGFFDLFGARPAVGRLLDAADHGPDAAPVVVLGHDAWLQRWGGDPGIVGRTLRLDDGLRTVVGVLEPGWIPPPEVTSSREFWVPFVPRARDEGSFYLAGVVRLRPGATLASLDEHMDAAVRQVHAAEGTLPTFLVGGAVMDYQEVVVGEVAGTLGRVLAAVFLLLLIACVNVAGLLLTRGVARERELAVRAALGASRTRLVRVLVGESALLALAGGLAGAALAWGIVELFRLRAPAGLPRLAEIALDGRGLAFALAVSFATVLVFGVLPALRAVRRASPGMGPRGGTPGRGEQRLRRGLVVVETGLAVLLAVGAGLLAHDLARLATEEPGFETEGLAVLSLTLPSDRSEEWAGMWEELLERTAALPGVTSAAVATQAPYDGARVAGSYRPQGWEGEETIFAIAVAVGGDYLEALGTRVVEGRAFGPADGDGEPAILVNEAFAREYWPGESAVGKTVASGQDDEPVYRVLGVLEDVRTAPGEEPAPHLFQPLRQGARGAMEILARTDGEAAALAQGLRGMVRRFDPELPVRRIRTVESMAHQALAGPRFYAGLFGGFALVALLLAVVGVYGTTAYATRARLRETGIRLALGARRRQVVAGVVGRAGATVGLGVVLGLTGAWLAARALEGSLHHVGSRDLPTYAVVALVVGSAGIVAAWLPARAAGRADPASTLRQE